jgi:opacity protein-like surface antigen
MCEMMDALRYRVTAKSGFVLAAVLYLMTPAAQAQVAPIPYWIPGGPFGFGGETTTQYWGSSPDEDGFRKGFSFSSYNIPVNSFTGGFGASALTGGSGLSSDGAQYAYSFKSLGDTPVTFFGGVSSLRTTPDVFTSLVTPGLERNSTLATSINAGVEFKPTSNLTLSLSGSFVQSSPPLDTDMRSQLPFAQNPGIFGQR